MKTAKQTREPRTRRVRRLALALVLGASAALATVGSTGIALAFEPNADAADESDIVRKMPGRTNAAALAFEPNGPTTAFPPGPGVIGPEV